MNNKNLGAKCWIQTQSFGVENSLSSKRKCNKYNHHQFFKCFQSGTKNERVLVGINFAVCNPTTGIKTEI
ncbi:hypothetical protein Ocin01_12661 [Orchesella cincta]|uniref:Uncharacterized protein n=1 Tax=Orchesella cincta TaxID=48709 RepID=A0A1D2MM69_ORCCI|nr:hypothetical protein Ocin01_12661 [Orchesella cincta]